MSWEELEAACLACRRCSLADTRTNVVFGTGARNAEVMFIGEGPGEQEDLQGVPFVGRAGRLLDDMLAAIGLSRDTVYIANIVKCRPPNNRDPLNVEAEACLEYLRAQARLVSPKLVVCLGRVAANHIIHENFKITRERGVWTDRGAYKLMATYHPSYLLRDPRRRPEAFSDMKLLERQILDCCEHTALD